MLKHIFISLAVAVFLSIVPRFAAGQDRLNFAYISPNAGSSSVLWVAKEAGIFKKHGLDVNVIYIEGSPKALMSLFAGELQVVAGTGPAVASARVRGADASMIMGFEVYLPYYLVAAPGIKSVEELKGKVGPIIPPRLRRTSRCVWGCGTSAWILKKTSTYAWSARLTCA
jgi:ABC-type nitrate/sulfonate/bicarbonate transport system substrate-binding protein